MVSDMAKQRIVLVSLACFSLTLLGAELPPPTPPKLPPFKPGMTREEWKKEIEQYREEYRQKNLKAIEQDMKVAAREAWKNLLRVTEGQWTPIEPKYKAVATLVREAHVCALGSGGLNQENFRWDKYSKGTGGNSAKALDEMTEGERKTDELIDFLEDPNSTDDQIRKKIDALQQVRENARKALPKAEQELAAVLTTPRHEAIFLIKGYID